MSKLIKASIDVTKIKKEHLFEGKKGTYANVDIWINDQEDDYGNICSIAQSFKTDNGFDKVYIGNGKYLQPKNDVPPFEPANDVSGDAPDDLPF